jgi:succinyl-CoA synthetase beta subunit
LELKGKPVNRKENRAGAARVLTDALEKGQGTLSEFDAKRLLSGYGVPVTREALAKDAVQAVAIARQIGGPVAMKACGAEWIHKTEAGLVRLNLSADAQVAAAFEELSSRAGGRLEGILVQEMVAGERELVAGLVRDAQFGPCVMLGLGGVLTEALDDAVMRMAPVDEADVARMIGELRCQAIFGPWRGQAPADVKALAAVLAGLSRIGLEHGPVAEIDVNPLIITAAGSLVAVDAFVVLQKGS